MNEEEIKLEFKKIWEKVEEIENKMGDMSPFQKISQADISEKKLDIESFCKNLDITEEKLRRKIDFQDEMPRIMVVPKEKTRTKIQYNSLMILGLLYKKIYEKPIDNNKLIEIFRFSKIPIDRLDKLFVSPMFKKFFTRVGKEIKFSWAGEKEAEKIIKELSKNGKSA